MRIEKYLDEVMKRNGFRRDKQLAEWLGVAATSICNYRNGERSMDNEKCVKIALELGVDPLQIIMATDMDKAARAGQHSLWEVFSQRMAAPVTSALLIGFVTLFLTAPTPSEAKTLRNASEYKLCEVKKIYAGPLSTQKIAYPAKIADRLSRQEKSDQSRKAPFIGSVRSRRGADAPS
jgi:transcriptional regulator with XRE-family HTH domain